MEMVAQHMFCFLVLFTSVIPIKSVPQCHDTQINQSCCFPKRFLQKSSEACPFMLINNSKVTCSGKGEMEDISSINDTYSGEPFCSQTCPDNFQVMVNNSISFCMQCAGACEFNVLARYGNGTNDYHDSKESHIATIAIILSAIALTICAIGTAIYCFFKKRRRCRQSQASCRNGDHNKAVSQSPVYVNTEIKVYSKPDTSENVKNVTTDIYENVQVSRKTERIGNYYGKDPTTNPKTALGTTEDLEGTFEISYGIQNNGYDTIDESDDDISKEHTEVPDYGNLYVNTEKQHILYENQQTSDIFSNEKLKNKNSGENLVESSAENITAVNTNKVILGSCKTLTAVHTESLTVGHLEHLTLNVQNAQFLQVNDRNLHIKKVNTL